MHFCGPACTGWWTVEKNIGFPITEPKLNLEFKNKICSLNTLSVLLLKVM